MSQAVVKEQEKAIVLSVGALKYAEFEQTHIVVTIDDLSITPEDVVKPEFWANHGVVLANSIKGHAFPKVDVYWKDGSIMMELICIGAGKLYAHMRIKSCVKLWRPDDFFNIDDSVDDNIEPIAPPVAVKTESNNDISNDFKVGWISPSSKNGVKRLSDKEILVDKLETKEEAEVWFKQYLESQ